MNVSPPTVLVLTHWFDPTADSVVRALAARGVDIFRCDAAEFPGRLAMTGALGPHGWGASLRNGHRSVDLANVVGAYYRRPSRFDFSAGMSDEERSWAAAEARYGFGGLLSATLPWLNHPAAIARAEYKPLQLQAAARSGLRVPETLLTNDPDAARRFADRLDGRVVYKSLSGQLISADGEFKAIYTTPLPPSDQGHPDVALTAHLFQQQIIDKTYEVRLTVAGDRLFAAAIHTGSGSAPLDWRRDYANLAYTPIDVPDGVADGVPSLMHMLDLRFGALDFAVTATGQWWFLEVNPNGQWGWIEDATGLPITAAIADELSGGNQ